MLKAWLESRTPKPPDPLAKRILGAIDATYSSDPATIAERLSAAAVASLRDIGSDGAAAESRAAALDLLAADALITYALEAAAEDCGTFAAITDAITAQIAALGSPMVPRNES